MSTDTAFSLGALALVGPGVPDRVRTYLLTFALADDVAGIVVIALAYSGHIDLTALDPDPDQLPPATTARVLISSARRRTNAQIWRASALTGTQPFARIKRSALPWPLRRRGYAHPAGRTARGGAAVGRSPS